MIIKSISHTSHRASIRNLIAYVFGDSDMHNDQVESVTITHLLRGKRNSWAEQFERIESRRKSFYKGKEVRYYHEILSFSPTSQPTKQELEDLIWKYLELRLDAPTLAFSAVHFSKSHYHAHLIIQGIDLYGKSIRKSKASFRDNVQVALNSYQQKYHPRLSDSIVDYATSSQNKQQLSSHNAYQRKVRTGEQTHKETVVEIIQRSFLLSDSLEGFQANLALCHIDCYFRRGVLTGVLYQGRKYRLKKTLGLDFELLLQPNTKHKRMERIKTIRDQQIINPQHKQR